MGKRINHANVGSIFTLKFKNGSVEDHMLIYFHGIYSDLENCRATFRSIEEDKIGEEFEWDVYRHNKRWCYGTSADILIIER